MDFPVHVAAAVCAGQVLIYANSRINSQNTFGADQNLMFATACVVAGAATHLLLDAVPHYDFLYGAGRLWKHVLPYAVRKGLQAPKILLITLPVFLILWKYARRHWMLTLLALVGGIYPDFEKAAYLHSAYPRALVLFPWHSCSYSPEGWEVAYRELLIAGEIVLYVGLLAALVWFSQRNRCVHHQPGQFETALTKTVDQLQTKMTLWLHKAPQREL